MATKYKKMTTLWRAKALFANPGKLLRVFRDPRTPFIAKALPILAVAYVFFPIDLIPDFIPILGQLDDISIALYMLSVALNQVPEEVFRSVGIDFEKVSST